MDEPPTLVIACALKQESDALQARLRHPVPVITTGLGTDRTLATLEKLYVSRRPGLLLFTGMAGQLDPSLQVGDFVFPAAWALESGVRFESDPDLVARLQALGCPISGLGLTVRRPVVKQKQRMRLFQDTGARICDMESAAALMVSRSFGVPCLAPKVVSDTAASGMLSFFRNFESNLDRLAGHLGPVLECLDRLTTPEAAAGS